MKNRVERGRELFELGLRLSALGAVAIGYAGGTLAETLARCVGCGAALGGVPVWFHDGSCGACGRWTARYYGVPTHVFVRQTGKDVAVELEDASGREPQLPDGMGQGACTGRWELLTGTESGWAARRAGGARWSDVVTVDGPPALTLMLERIGCTVLDHPAQGVPLLQSDTEGFRLLVKWNGRSDMPQGEDALAAAVHWLDRGQTIPAFGAKQI